MGLQSMKQSEMSAVIFIQDYIQLIFEGAILTHTLTAYKLPTVLAGERQFTADTPGIGMHFARL